jgi:hypothetical protein
VENIRTKSVSVDENMLREFDLSLYESFHKEDGTEEEASSFTTGREWLHRFRNRYNFKIFKTTE